MTDQPTPAIILCDPVIGSLKVGALSLLDRLAVTLHRAGCFPIRVICNGTLPSLPRSRALGIRPELVAKIPALDRTTLVARCEIIVQTSDVKKIIRESSRLTDRSGGSLPIGMVSPEAAAAVCETMKRGNLNGAGELGANAETEKLFGGINPIRAEGIATLVNDPVSARRAERMLWNSLASDSDGIVDVYFNRPVGRILSKIIIHTSITPNQVSVCSVLIGLAGAYCFCKGQHAWSVWGAVLFQISAIVDCVDGDVARMVFKESPMGKWLDIVGDQVVHIAVFAGIALGAWHVGLGLAAWILGVSAITGALLSFWVVLRGMRLPKDPNRARQQQFVDKATSRDFSVLVLALAFLDKLPWFLWVTAIGVHVFWITALWLQWPSGERAATKETCSR